jgi:hypothetical protein
MEKGIRFMNLTSVFSKKPHPPEDQLDVKSLKPLFNKLKKSEFGDIIVTAPSSDIEYDFK